METTKTVQAIAPGAAASSNGTVHYYEVWKITGQPVHGCGDRTAYVLTLGGTLFPDLTQMHLGPWRRIDTVERLGEAHTVEDICPPPL